jgi:predicted amidohydrolase YtcJ
MTLAHLGVLFLAMAAAGARATVAETPVSLPADLVLTGGRVWTAEPGQPWAEAVAIRAGRIVGVGSPSEVAALRGPKTEVLDLRGRLVVPGFNDAHIHLVEGALSLDAVDLIEEQTLAAVQARIKAFAAGDRKSAWVQGRGWLYGSFPGGLPTREQLDAVVGDRPAYMECYDGHSGWANSMALSRAGITKDTKDPEGGVIVRDPRSGEPTGALKESARELVKAVIPSPDEEARYRLLLRGLALLNSQGITSVQDARSDSAPLSADLPLLDRARREGKLTVRVRAANLMKPGDWSSSIPEARRLADRFDDALLRVGSVKAYVDGVIEAHTAALLEPYAEAAFGLGLPNWEPDALKAAVVAADGVGLQVYLHAIGDRGVRMALDAHEAARLLRGPRDRRGRIEHIETIAASDYPRFKELGVIASMQPLHANPDQNNFEVWQRNIGPERAVRGFSWGNLERAGARLVFGSDWPVVTSDVFRGLYCAVARKTREGNPPDGWLKDQAVSLESALRHYTIDGAYASFEEQEKGRVAAGKRADLAVLSANLFEGAPEAILKTKVLLTVMDGRIVHRDAGF